MTGETTFIGRAHGPEFHDEKTEHRGAAVRMKVTYALGTFTS